MKYILIQAGCAECRFGLTEPLIQISKLFDTPEEAKADAWQAQRGQTITWTEHQQGGWFHADGQGDDWVLPVPDNFPTLPEFKYKED